MPWKYPDDSMRAAPPARVVFDGFHRKFADLTPAERDALGYNETVPAAREPFTEYVTRWEKGDDLIYRETVVESVVDEAARDAALAETVRARRDRLLAESDWTQLPDSPCGDETRSDWAAYRAALRDVPQQSGFPTTVAWPDSPA